jgi:hypothetical protein
LFGYAVVEGFEWLFKAFLLKKLVALYVAKHILEAALAVKWFKAGFFFWFVKNLSWWGWW